MADAVFPKINTLCPDFSLATTEETKVTLSDCLGSWTVLYCYPKDSTPGCTTEALEFSTLQQKFADLHCQIFGISPDSVASHCRFRDKKALTVSLLSDPDHSFLQKIGAWQEKKNFGRAYMGVVRSTLLLDPKGRIRHIWPKVKASGHAAEVLKTLQGLLST